MSKLMHAISAPHVSVQVQMLPKPGLWLALEKKAASQQSICSHVGATPLGVVCTTHGPRQLQSKCRELRTRQPRYDMRVAFFHATTNSTD